MSGSVNAQDTKIRIVVKDSVGFVPNAIIIYDSTGKNAHRTTNSKGEAEFTTLNSDIINLSPRYVALQHIAITDISLRTTGDKLPHAPYVEQCSLFRTAGIAVVDKFPLHRWHQPIHNQMMYDPVTKISREYLTPTEIVRPRKEDSVACGFSV